MTKKKKTLIIRILLFGATEISLFFVPWILVKAWILPLPDTIQEQVDETIGHGFDGMIVYVELTGQRSNEFEGGLSSAIKHLDVSGNRPLKHSSFSAFT